MEPKTNRSPESVVREIKRKTRRKFNPEEKIRIFLEGLKGEESIAAICRREGIAPSLYYKWSKSFLEADKQRLKGDTMREATTYSMMGRLEDARDLVSKAFEFNPKTTAELWRKRFQYKCPKHTERILGLAGIKFC